MGLISAVTKPIGCILTFIGAMVVLAVLLVAGMFWAIEEMAPAIAEQTFTEATGFPAKVDEVEVKYLKQQVRFVNVEIDNPEDFADREFLKINEFSISLDRSETDEEQITLGELVLDIEELAFLEGVVAMSNLEAFMETAEHGWRQALEQIKEEAANQDQVVPANLVIRQVHIRLDRIKLVDAASGPDTIYRVVDVGYERTFEDVSEPGPILEAIADELRSKGFLQIAQPITNAAD